MVAVARAFIIALVLTPIARDVFRAYNVVDRPGRRKVHAYPIPRVGGIPIVAGYIFALFQLVDPNLAMPRDWIWALAPGATAIFLTGLIDDFFNLRPIVKLIGQIGAAVLVYANGIRIETLAGRHLPEWISLPLTLFWLLLTTNALNLIDGLDGLCAGLGFFAALTLGISGFIQGNAPLYNVAFPLAGAMLGFLIYNLNPATVFLGDSGALSIGFLLGCFGLIWTQESTTLATTAVPLLALAVPLLDVLLSVIRRFLKAHPLFAADRGHTHHRLLDRGLSVRQSGGVLYLFAATAGVFAILLTWRPEFGGYHAAVLAGFCIACWAGIRQLRYAELEVAGSLLFGEFRKTVAVRVRLEHLRETLARAVSSDDWWATLVRTARDEHLIRISWNEDSGEREVTLSDATPGWSLEVRLEEGRSLQLSGTAPEASSDPGLDLIRLTAILRETYSAVLRRTSRVAVG